MKRYDYGLGELEENEPVKGQKKKRQLKSEKANSMNGLPARVLIWRIIKPVLAVLIGLSIVGVAVTVIYHKVDENYFSPVDPSSTQEIKVTIESGSSLSKISETLEEKGVIRNAKAFKYYVDFSDMSSKLVAGTYFFTPNMTFDDIIDLLKRPVELKKTVKLTFREGLTIEEIADIALEEGLIETKEELLEEVKDAENFLDNSFISAVNESEGASQRKYLMEGYLFPDTYEFYTETSAKEIVSKMLVRFNQIFSDAFLKRAEEIGMTPDEVVTLASMIEKEAKTQDFKKVSAVFHSRIKEGWTLDSDACVQYFMGERKLIWNAEDLKTDSPYNTHIYKGLPIGPVCNPSKAAIEAALYPDEETLQEGYMFFCLGDPATGEMVYSKTLKEHEEATAAYYELWKAYDAQINQKNETK